MKTTMVRCKTAEAHARASEAMVRAVYDELPSALESFFPRAIGLG